MLVAVIEEIVPELVAARKAIGDFQSLIRSKLATQLDIWTECAKITRLKLIKRQMYGRAKLDLLQARLLGAT